MKNRMPIILFLTAMIVIFVYLICNWTVFTTTKTITIPGEGTYSGQMRNGHFNGTGTWQSKFGVTYTGEFKEGMYDGQGTMTFANGATYTGGFKDGHMHGYGIMTFPDGHTQEGEWEANQFQTDHECDHDH